MKVKDLFDKIKNPKDEDYGKLLILFQATPEAIFRGKFMPIKDPQVMYGTNDYEMFQKSLKKSASDYVYDLVINKELGKKGLHCWPIFDEDVLKGNGHGEGVGQGYTFNIYLYPANELSSYKDTYINGHHKRYDQD